MEDKETEQYFENKQGVWDGSDSKYYDLEGNEFVIFKHPTKQSTEKIMDLVGFQQDINNTFADTQCLYFLGEFFPIFTKFFKNKVVTKDKTYKTVIIDGVRTLE